MNKRGYEVKVLIYDSEIPPDILVVFKSIIPKPNYYPAAYE